MACDCITVETTPEVVSIETTTLDEVIQVGVVGPQGATGAGVPTGGITGYILAKASPADYDTEWIELPEVDLSSPPPIGNITPNAGYFTTISASGIATLPHIHGSLAGNLYVHVKNTSGGALSRGTPVYIVGNVGASDRVEVAAADYDDPAKMPALGLLETDLAQNGEGNAVIVGELLNANTSAYSLNSELYVGNNGTLTASVPTAAGQIIQTVGIVSRVQTNTGIIVVNMQGERSTMPNAHASTHYTNGSDPLAPIDIGAQPAFTYVTTTAGANLAAARAVRYSVESNPLAPFPYSVILPIVGSQHGDIAIFTANGTIPFFVSVNILYGTAPTYVSLATITQTDRQFSFRYDSATSSWIPLGVDVHTHSASAITSGTLDIARIPTGTDSSSVCIGDDARLSDARTPTSHAVSHEVGGSDPIFDQDVNTTDSVTFEALDVVSATDAVISLSPNSGSLSAQIVCYDDGGTAAVDFAIDGNSAFSFSNQYITAYSPIQFNGPDPAADAATTRTNLGLGDSATADIGTGSTEVAAGNHVHGNLTTDGKVGSVSGLPIVTTTAGAISALALGAASEVLRVNSGGTALEFGTAASKTDVYLSNGTWTKPAGAKKISILMIGGGGGGGAGRRGASLTVRAGGGGGQGGALVMYEANPDHFPATVTVNVGAGGTGGANSANDTNGADAANGGNTSLVYGTFTIFALGGDRGRGGSTASGAGGNNSAQCVGVYNTSVVRANGGSSVTTGGGGSGTFSNFAPTGGGSGGSITASDVNFGAGQGGTLGVSNICAVPGGVVPAAGSNGNNGQTSYVNLSGTGASGGRSNSTIGASGGNGGNYGGGGGGGSGALNNGGGSTAGGTGGAGIAIITTYF